MNGFWRGAKFAFDGLKLLKEPGLRRFVLIPFLINSVLFATVLYFSSTQMAVIFNSYLPSWLSWIEWLLWPVFILITLFVAFFLFTPVANLIAAPFNNALSLAVEKFTRGEIEHFDEQPLLADIGQSLVDELQKLAYTLPRLLILLVLLFIPGINVLVPVLWFVFGAWLMAVEYSDYPLGNRHIRFKSQQPMLAAQRNSALGFGMVINLMTLIPVLNFLAMPSAVCGATLWWDQYKSIKPRSFREAL